MDASAATVILISASQLERLKSDVGVGRNFGLSITEHAQRQLSDMGTS